MITKEFNIPEEIMKQAKDICIKENILGGEDRLKKYEYGLCVPGEFTNAPGYYGIMDTLDPYDNCYNNPFLIYDSKNNKLIVVDKAEFKNNSVYYIDHYTKEEKELI